MRRVRRAGLRAKRRVAPNNASKSSGRTWNAEVTGDTGPTLGTRTQPGGPTHRLTT
jgi:hypothetical protein